MRTFVICLIAIAILCFFGTALFVPTYNAPPVAYVPKVGDCVKEHAAGLLKITQVGLRSSIAINLRGVTYMIPAGDYSNLLPVDCFDLFEMKK